MLGRFLRNLLASKEKFLDEYDVLVMRGMAAFRALDFRTARNSLLSANTLRLLDAERLSMLGTALLYSGDLREAEVTLRSALDHNPSNVDARKMLAMKYLLDGDWAEGFRLYEACRHEFVIKTSDQRLSREWLGYINQAVAGIPPWRGESLTGKRLLVWSEYGHGDAIMNMRFLPVLSERFGVGEVAALSMATEQCLFEAAGVSRFFEALWEWRPIRGEFDFHCSIISLPYLLGVAVDNVPGRIPYLHVPEVKQSVWRGRVAGNSSLKVGLVWAGNPDMPLDKLRSLSVAQLAPLFAIKGVSFFSLQKDGAGRAELRGRRYPIVDLMDQCGDFMDTAALISNLDLVISVDSALAHLAGAIGKPVWLLNRFESEWRWMRDREDTPWYPSMRIFNQTEPRNWGPVVDRMLKELTVLASRK